MMKDELPTSNVQRPTSNEAEWFFARQMRQARLCIVAQSWIGTPFVAHSKICGAGVDCVHLCAEIYRECGLWESYSFPRYSLDGGAHRDSSQVLEWIRASGRFEVRLEDKQRKSEKDGPHAGDLVVFKFKRVEHHVGLMVTHSTFIHSVAFRGVTTCQINDPFFWRALTHVYRPMEVVR